MDENAALASTCVTALATGSMMDAAVLISIKTSKVMHVHRPMRVDATTKADVAMLGLSHKCDSCGREFTKQRGFRVHMARWCDGGRTQRSRIGTLTDKAGKTAKRRVTEAAMDRLYVATSPSTTSYISSILVGSQLQGDEDDEADVRHRMGVAQAAFGSLSHLWNDHRLSRATTLMLYRISVCSTLTHSCEAWTLTRTVVRINCAWLQPVAGCAHAPTEVPRPQAASARRELCAMLPVGPCEGRHARTTRRAASSARPGCRSWKPCRWIARLSVRKCRR